MVARSTLNKAHGGSVEKVVRSHVGGQDAFIS